MQICLSESLAEHIDFCWTNATNVRKMSDCNFIHCIVIHSSDQSLYSNPIGWKPASDYHTKKCANWCSLHVYSQPQTHGLKDTAGGCCHRDSQLLHSNPISWKPVCSYQQVCLQVTYIFSIKEMKSYPHWHSLVSPKQDVERVWETYDLPSFSI